MPSMQGGIPQGCQNLRDTKGETGRMTGPGGRSGNIEGVSGSGEVMLRPHHHESLSTSGDFSGWLHAPPICGLGSRSTPDDVIDLGLGSCLQQAGLR